MFKTFNMGIGMVICVESSNIKYILDENKNAYLIGRVTKDNNYNVVFK